MHAGARCARAGVLTGRTGCCPSPGPDSPCPSGRLHSSTAASAGASVTSARGCPSYVPSRGQGCTQAYPVAPVVLGLSRAGLQASGVPAMSRAATERQAHEPTRAAPSLLSAVPAVTALACAGTWRRATCQPSRPACSRAGRLASCAGAPRVELCLQCLSAVRCHSRLRRRCLLGQLWGSCSCRTERARVWQSCSWSPLASLCHDAQHAGQAPHRALS